MELNQITCYSQRQQPINVFGIKIKGFEKTVEFLEGKLEQLFPKERDRNVASSILYLCSNKDSIDNFNKKALYIMIIS